MKGRRAFILALVCFICGCATSGGGLQDDPLLQVVIGEIAEGDPATELLLLDDDIKHLLDERVSREWSDVRKSRQLSEFLFEEQGIRYEALSNQSASKTYHARLGNCLALSSLFIAAARYLEFDAHFEIVQVDPSWARSHDTMIRYEHIVASGDLAGRSYVIDLLRPFRYEDDLRKDISDRKALALFYSNQAVEALLVDDLDGGLDWMRRAARLWPDNSNIWNNLATVYRRSGDNDLAEASYRRSLELDRLNYSALANLTRLFMLENRVAEAGQYMKRVQRYYRRNPYYRVQLAQVQIEQGEFEQARRNLNRASRLQQGDPTLHEALSASYALMGDAAESDVQREKAREARARFQLQLTSES